MNDISQAFDMTSEEDANSPEVLKTLRESLQELISLEEGIEQLEEDLKAAKKAREVLRTLRIPDLMAEIQSDEFTHAGWKFKLEDFVTGSLPKDPGAKAKALEWLEHNDGEGLIKSELSLAFAKSQYEEAKKLTEDLIKEGYAPTLESSVHPQTLLAYARQRIKDGDSIDLDILGLYTGKIAKAKKL